jgi:hypothetical protein
MLDNLTTDTEQQKQPVTLPEENKSNDETNGEETTNDGLGENHPLYPLMGKYKDDPTWDEFMELIKQHRRETDEFWNKIYEEEERQNKTNISKI